MTKGEASSPWVATLSALSSLLSPSGGLPVANARLDDTIKGVRDEVDAD